MALIGVDWGSSSLRCYLFNDQFELMQSRHSSCGIKFVADDQFQETLLAEISTWLDGNDTLILSGMITSRSGWIETPYIDCPANPANMLQQAVKMSLEGMQLIFLPGLCQRDPQADVMRGEELQLLGVSASSCTSSDTHKAQWMVLPGTHSKWAKLEVTPNSTVVSQFTTIATGELYEVLLKHSLIGQLANLHTWSESRFETSVLAGFNTANLISKLFSARAGVLLDTLETGEVSAYLSGLLIGCELREGIDFIKQATNNAASGASATETCTSNSRSTWDSNNRIRIIGSESLSERYLKAFQVIGLPCSSETANVSPQGYRQLLQAL